MGQCSGQGRGFLLRALTFLPSAVFTRQHQEKSQVGWTAARRRRAATAHWATAPQPILFDVCSARGCLQPVCTAQRCLQCAAVCTACKVVCTMQGCLQHVEILAVLEDICSMLGTLVQTGMLVVHGGICGSPWCLQPVGMLAVHGGVCSAQESLHHPGVFEACRHIHSTLQNPETPSAAFQPCPHTVPQLSPSRDQAEHWGHRNQRQLHHCFPAIYPPAQSSCQHPKNAFLQGRLVQSPASR